MFSSDLVLYQLGLLLVMSIVIKLIIYMKKLLDSDWLRAVQFRGNTSANYKYRVDAGENNGRPGFSLGQQQ